MSIFPCDVHKRRVPGALQSYRVTVMSSSDRFTRRMRVCDEHFVDAVSNVQRLMARVSAFDDEPPGNLCGSCGSSSERGAHPAAAFAWTYAKREEPVEWYGVLCHRCAVNLVQSLELEPDVRTPEQVEQDIEASQRWMA